MQIAFTLSMPGNSSWNGRWSGEGKIYCVIKNVGTSKKAVSKYREMSGKYFSYNFGDGWRAGISVREVTREEARKLRKQSQGFCGYEWMIESIIKDGAIYGPTQPKPEALVS